MKLKPCYWMKYCHDQVYDGIFQNQLGWGSIDADEIYREEIINIYHDILQNTQD